MARHGREGFILVAVLGVMALLAGLVGAVSLLVRSGIETARVESDELALTALVRAGVELAGYQLHGLGLPVARIDTRQIRLDAGTVTLFVADESARIDLNGADPAVLAGVWRAGGLTTLTPRAFAARVLDWRDLDDARSPDGAEAADYATAGRDDRPRNDAFRQVADLAWVLGVREDDVAELASLLTIDNPDGRINVLAASRQVLLALPGITPATVERVLALRQTSGPAVARSLTTLLQPQKDFIKLEPGPAYRVRVEARLKDDRLKTAEVVLIRSPTSDALYHVTHWSE